MVFTMYTKETKRQSALEKARFIRAQNYNLKIQKTASKKGGGALLRVFCYLYKNIKKN